jgi:hypothetical protein
MTIDAAIARGQMLVKERESLAHSHTTMGRTETQKRKEDIR